MRRVRNGRGLQVGARSYNISSQLHLSHVPAFDFRSRGRAVLPCLLALTSFPVLDLLIPTNRLSDVASHVMDRDGRLSKTPRYCIGKTTAPHTQFTKIRMKFWGAFSALRWAAAANTTTSFSLNSSSCNLASVWRADMVVRFS